MRSPLGSEEINSNGKVYLEVWSATRLPCDLQPPPCFRVAEHMRVQVKLLLSDCNERVLMKSFCCSGGAQHPGGPGTFFYVLVLGLLKASFVISTDDVMSPPLPSNLFDGRRRGEPSWLVANPCLCGWRFAACCCGDCWFTSTFLVAAGFSQDLVTGSILKKTVSNVVKCLLSYFRHARNCRSAGAASLYFRSFD